MVRGSLSVGMNNLSEFNYKSIHTTENWTHFVKSIKEMPAMERVRLMNEDTYELMQREELYDTYKHHPDIRHTGNSVKFPEIDDFTKIGELRLTTASAANVAFSVGNPIVIKDRVIPNFAIDCTFYKHVDCSNRTSKWTLKFIPWKQMNYKKGLLILQSDHVHTWLAFVKTRSVLDALELKGIAYDHELIEMFPEI